MYTQTNGQVFVFSLLRHKLVRYRSHWKPQALRPLQAGVGPDWPKWSPEGEIGRSASDTFMATLSPFLSCKLAFFFSRHLGPYKQLCRLENTSVNCAPRCKKRKRVSRTTFYCHAKYRDVPLMDCNTFAEMHASKVPTLVPTSSSASCRHPTEANDCNLELEDPSGGCPSGRHPGWSMEKSVSPASNGPQEDGNDGGAGRGGSEPSDNGDQVRSLIKLCFFSKTFHGPEYCTVDQSTSAESPNPRTS